MVKVKRSIFGVHQGQEIECFTLSNLLGYRLSVMTYGATILEYVTPNRKGIFDNIVVGSSRLADYVKAAPRWGAAIGPVAGRIANGQFQLNGQLYQLSVQENGHHLHGGLTGFDNAVFQVESIEDDCIRLYLERKDGTGGYPGNVKTWITYQLKSNGAVVIDYRIQTDKDTLVNPTNHSYFNLTGHWQQNIENIQIQLAVRSYLELDPHMIPTGKRIEDSTALSALRKGVRFSEFLTIEEDAFTQIGGIDHPFELDKTQLNAVILTDDASGRMLTVQTEAPSVVIYTANSFEGNTFLEGQTPIAHCGIALETQLLPDAIHHPDFGNIILSKDEEFRSRTVYHATVIE